MALIGKVGEFDSSCEDFSSYEERLGQFFLANRVKTDRRVAVFLSVIGAKTYGLLKSLIMPDTPSEKTYGELITVLKKHLTPKPLVIAERFKFHHRNQNDGESVSACAAELKRLSRCCEFGQFLQEALRDKFVCGIRNVTTQRKLLAQENLTYAKSLECALAMEMAEQNVSEIKLGTPAVVHKMDIKSEGSRKYRDQAEIANNGSKSASSKSCYRCNGTDHTAADCRFKMYECNKCHKIGHLARACRSKLGTSRNNANLIEIDNHAIPIPNTQQEDLSLFELYNINGRTEPIKINVTIEGTEIFSMKLDTGATMSVLPEDIYREKFPNLKLNQMDHGFKAYGGDKVETLGQAEVSISYQDQSARLPIVVAKVRGQPPLLGRNWLGVLRLDWASIFTVRKAPNLEQSNSDTVERLLHRYKDLLSGELGTLKVHKATIKVKDDISPKFFKPRPVPYALREVVGKELDRLELEGIISKVEHSRSPAELFLKRQIRTKFSFLKPSLGSKVQAKQEEMKQQHDKGRESVRSFEPGDRVMVRNFRGSDKWLAGIVMQRLGSLSYIVDVNGIVCHVHVDHLISGVNRSDEPFAQQTVSRETVNESSAVIEPHIPQVPTVEEASPQKVIKPLETQVKPVASKLLSDQATGGHQPTRTTYPKRESKLPSYLKDYQVDLPGGNSNKR
ncbi:hypothetical protein HOLleu_07152 [Holothuria leucospilota]|uniref:Uncharacterized protein n=1 Tax=Holothuria leucospilota TaxID=206669 RepID=A0A9Q1HCL3_HOLLE|nr:hypothetical protein HOLleu_07152 [Holothuria leucospilota]